ncbi:MAG: DUF4351 domain-containing protein, partial [Alcaligenaceae bacterium]|nr:DUF4351 domain-containing protein [Alcaligenaceae bacterium]
HNMALVNSFERVGIQKVKVEGEADLLLRQITRKFGSFPKATRQRIQTATSAQLETWSLNILDAETLDEVFLDGC